MDGGREEERGGGREGGEGGGNPSIPRTRHCARVSRLRIRRTVVLPFLWGKEGNLRSCGAALARLCCVLCVLVVLAFFLP